MAKTKYFISDEQREFRNKIVKNRISQKHVGVKPSPKPIKLPTTFDYMQNCMYWIKEYIEGRTNRDIVHIIHSLVLQADKLLNEIKPKQ